MNTHSKSYSLSRWSALAIVLALSLALAAAPALATTCNTVGCFSAPLFLVKVAPDGKIWFVVEGSAALDALVPPDGCIVKNLFTGVAEPALYIRSDDPERDEKYTMLLTAFTTGSKVAFGPVKDPATGWCSLAYLDIR